MTLWGLLDLTLREVIEFFPSREVAEATLQEILLDEPDWVDVLVVEPISFCGVTCPN